MRLPSILGGSISGSRVVGACGYCGYLKSLILVLENLESIACLFPAFFTFGLQSSRTARAGGAVGRSDDPTRQRALQARGAGELHA